ncbi:hypothetical protein BGW38_003327 [Lunasporangiospora selenospora]|uniref:Uncharacterized protein n=1 Tax=Lunasporangiospora selenospora TaxID=979761 RepID=A0A9P6KCA3_9FUNG|nr:hypothetical protein BGW38_003327 [Lunasporangiospora selenospora]
MIRTKLKTNASSSVGDSATASKNSGTTGPTTISARQRRLQTAREISALLKQQWRPGLLALCLLFIDMIYWLFYFTEAKKLEKIGPTTPWFVNWIRCLGEQAILNLSQVGATTMTEQQKIQWMGEVAQRTCASIARPFVPSFSWAALSDTLPATFGCFLMIIFGTKVELWQDVAARLFRRPDANRPRRRFESPDARLERLENARRASPGGADGDQDLIEMSNGFDLYYHYRGSPSTRQTNPNGALDIRDFYTADGSWVEPESSRQEPQPDQPGQDDSTPLSETMHFGGKQPRKKSLRKKKSLLLSSAKLSLGSPSHPAPPSSLASPMSDSETLEGMIRKNSVSFADREPVYYRNPVKNGLGEGSTTSPVELGLSLDRQQSLFERRQNQAQMIIEGSAPWPSWPSSSFNTTTPSAAPLVMVPSSPPLAHLPPVPTGMAGAPKKLSPISTPPNSGEIPAGQPRSPLTTRIPSAPTSPVRPLHHHHVQRAQDLSSKGFYNSEDLAAPPIHLSQFTSSHVQKIVLGGSQPNSTNAAREEKLTVPIRASSRAQRFDRSPSSPVQGQGGFANPIMTVPGSSPLPPPPQQSPPLVPRKSIRRGKGPA